MRKFTFTLSCIIISLICASQKKLPGFGQIELAELKLNSCQFEPDAPAMKVFDVQETEFAIFSDGPRLKTERRARIKIFNEQGFKYASIRIPYLNKKGFAKIKQLQAVVYNLDAKGKIVVRDLDKKDFFREKAAENVGIVKFTFPDLKAGSVIEFSYTTVENQMFQIAPWIIQEEIPVLYAENAIQIPAKSRLEKKIWGTDTVEEKTEHKTFGNFFKTTYYKEQIHSFRPEPYMSSLKDNLLRVTFLLFPLGNTLGPRSYGNVWQGAGRSLLFSYSFQESMNKTIPGTEGLIDSAKSILSLADKISFIFQKVKKRILYRTEQTFRPEDISEAWKTQSGNSADINLVLLNLLQKCGVPSYPMLVSTRENGKVNTQFPSISQMNGIDVVVIDSNKIYILDASLKFQSSQTPPFNILNRNAFLLKPDDMEWIFVSDNRPLLKETVQVYALLKQEGSLEGIMHSTHYDYAKSYLLDTTIEENDNREFFAKSYQGLTLKNITRLNTDDDSKPLQQKTEFILEPQQTGDYLFINPVVFYPKGKNPFTKEKRNTDIDFGCSQEFHLKLNISIPRNFIADFIPKSILVRAPDTSVVFQRTVLADNDGISLLQTFEIKKAIFSKEEYASLREFFQKVYTLMNEEIVLIRKK